MPSLRGPNIVEGVEKIAVLRAGGLGDAIFTLPALWALKETYPGAEITLLGGPLQTGLFSGGREPVARAILVPPSTGVNGSDTGVDEDEGELESFFEAMRDEHFDLALQMHGGGGYSNPFLRRLEARVTAGTRTPDAAPLDRTVPYIYHQSEIMRWLEVASLVGARTTEVEPRLGVKEEDLAEANAAVPEGEAPLVALHPGAGDLRRRWPSERFAAVADALISAGARVAVVGVEEDRPLVSEVVDAASGEVLDLCGRLSLGGLVGLSSRCVVMISNDSGPLHLAAAVGAATVGIYWGPNLINAGPPTRNSHRPVLSWQHRCAECGASFFEGDGCDHLSSVVAGITVEEVAGPALELLEAYDASASGAATTAPR